jgi:hypothetical protein
MSTISASTTSTTAYKVTADTTGTLVFQTGATPTTALTIGSDQSVTFAGAQTYTGGATFSSSISVQGITVGRGAGAVNGNTVLGNAALSGINTGTGLTAIGYTALATNNSGTNNTAVGFQALVGNNSGSNNTALGKDALVTNTTASNNTAVGYQAGYTNATGTRNTFFGEGAGYSTTSSFNTFIGNHAGYSATGGSNTFVGDYAGYLVTTGAKNTIIGKFDGNSGSLDIRTASNYIVLSDGDGNPRGWFTGGGLLKVVNASSAVENATAGVNEIDTAANDTNLLVRNTAASLTAARGGVDVVYAAAAPNGTTSNFYNASDTGGKRFEVRSNGGIGNYSANDVNLSDRREKTNFAPAKSYLDVICAIPVQTFNYIDQNLEKDDGLTLGVVAQDVQAVAPELVIESDWGTKEEPKVRLSIYQTDLQYALMKCIQELKAEVDSLKAQINGASA